MFATVRALRAFTKLSSWEVTCHLGDGESGLCDAADEAEAISTGSFIFYFTLWEDRRTLFSFPFNCQDMSTIKVHSLAVVSTLAASMFRYFTNFALFILSSHLRSIHCVGSNQLFR